MIVMLAGPAIGQVGASGVVPASAPPVAVQAQIAPVSGATVPSLDPLAQARSAADAGDAPEALSRYLRVLATAPDDVGALAGAGRAALAVGDLNAAIGFFGRAEARAPNDGAIKAGIGATLVRQGDARGALRYFRAAAQLGVAEAAIAADRGLAYDLRGDDKHAQAEYALALRGRPGDAETVRRLALSQAIGGDRAAALATLDPQLRRQDVPAWRTRMFVRALTGDVAGAGQDAALVLPTPQVAALAPYLARLATLRPADKAAAVFLGRFPAERQAAAAGTTASTFGRPAIATSPPAAVSAFANVPLPPPAGPATVPPPSPLPSLVDLGPPADASGVPDSAALRALKRRVAGTRGGEAPPPPPPRTAAERPAPAKPRAAAGDPARHWVQVAGGANARDLPRAWTALKAKYPTELAGRSPSTMHYRHTNRLLIGPFPDGGAAQAWVTEQRKKGLAAFQVTTAAGEAVAPLD